MGKKAVTKKSSTKKKSVSKKTKAKKKSVKKAAKKTTISRKKTSRKKTKKTKKKSSVRSSVGTMVRPPAALAMNAAETDDFYADELKIGRNAHNADERRITRQAAMILWREEDVDALIRDETGIVWGWAMRRYDR